MQVIYSIKRTRSGYQISGPGYVCTIESPEDVETVAGWLRYADAKKLNRAGYVSYMLEETGLL
jgi:hypothetical protein